MRRFLDHRRLVVVGAETGRIATAHVMKANNIAADRYLPEVNPATGVVTR